MDARRALVLMFWAAAILAAGYIAVALFFVGEHMAVPEGIVVGAAVNLFWAWIVDRHIV